MLRVAFSNAAGDLGKDRFFQPAEILIGCLSHNVESTYASLGWTRLLGLTMVSLQLPEDAVETRFSAN